MELRVATVAVALVTAFGAAACGGGSSGATPSQSPAGTTTGGTPSGQPSASGTAPADPAAAKAEITKVWTTFFDSRTSVADSVSLLQDGDQLGPALKVAQREDRQSGLKRRARVKLILFQDPTTANVTWMLLNGKTPVLNNASGQAVFVDGQWRVSKTTFCTLVNLGNNGKEVTGCTSGT